MQNLRLIYVSVIDSKNIEARFTASLSTKLVKENITIISQTQSVPNAEVLEITINDDVMTIITQPLTPFCPYLIKFNSTKEIKFLSFDNNALLYEDGVTNQRLILGPTTSDNIAQDFFISFLRDNIYYKMTDPTSVVGSILQSYSQILSKALYDIRQLKNENYLSYNITDEKKVRGAGPFDRLNEECAYEILRIGKTKTNTSANLTFSFDEFNESPVTLLSTSIAEEEVLLSSIDKIGLFNLNTLTITVENYNVSKLTELVINYDDGSLPYYYNIAKYGYQILDSKYDQSYGFSYAILDNNQFKLSSLILEDENFSTNNILNIKISYEYKNLGRVIDTESIIVDTVINASREVIPPITNIFTLKNAPITNSNGDLISSGGLRFTNPNTLDGETHPAFLYEIPYYFGAIPSNAGEYNIDYSTGTVYVYGEDSLRSGTGPFPPLVSYNYKYRYKNEIDYVIDEDNNDLVALSNGSLINNSGDISFSYEEVLIPGIDYKAELHKENLAERIGNKLVALNCLKTQHAPITNIFRIFNETSGEVYRLVRWFNDKVYFNFNNPPNVKNQINERVSFQNQINELIFVDSTLTNDSSIKIFKCKLLNDKIIASSEDCTGASFNSSVQLSDNSIFNIEKWYDSNQSIEQNIDRLIQIGQYKIDYINGILYVAVANNQNLNLGTITYKNNLITPQNPHIISVDDLYYLINFSNPKNKTFQYDSFDDGFIKPLSLDVADEAFLNNVLTAPYQSYNNVLGSFVDEEFVPIITNDIKSIRGLYEFQDLFNSSAPLNFVEYCTFSAKTITISPFDIVEYSLVNYDGYEYSVNVNINMPYLSPNLQYTISIFRESDSAQLWDASGTIMPGNPLKLILSGINAPQDGDRVKIELSISIVDLSRIIVDYNKGEYYIDYSYLADEIIVSYEYGENHIDFRESLSISENTEYYVSYKVGALRDSLMKNFGSLINIPELSTFDVDFERERYRDALSAALESFLQGPTVSAIKNICKNISHVEPEIIESIFANWSLGSSLLNPVEIATTGEFELISSKYSNGALINNSNQTISLPASSNLKIENGTFETWITPEWNGLDNNSELTFTILKDGYVFPSNQIFIGAAEAHPEYIDDKFSLKKDDSISIGLPNKNRDGIFIYYDNDVSGTFKRWFINVIDGYSDGNVDGYTSLYNIKISNSGLFYDIKSINYPQPSSVKITSGTNQSTLIISGNKPIDQGMTFIADREYYILDVAEEKNKNRICIFKDPSGYLNFKIYDDLKNSYGISSDISSWRSGDKHYIAASWKLGTINNRDELHLFIDGMEVPNIIKYGKGTRPYLHEKFRTINPEEIVGQITNNIVGSVDLETTQGSNIVSSSLSFDAYGIEAGSTLYIDEPGFDVNGYVVTLVNGNSLTLSDSMPFTIDNGKFSINRQEFEVTNQIDIFPNIYISTLTSIIDGDDLSSANASNVVSSSSYNFENEEVTPGFIIRIDHNQFENYYIIISVSGNSLTLNGDAPATLSSLNFHIYSGEEIEIPGQRALRPSYSISRNSQNKPLLILSNNVKKYDLIKINSLGINHKRVKKNIYQWGNSSNILRTQLAPPISLLQTEIRHIILPSTLINNLNSTTAGNTVTSDNLITAQPSSSDLGRTLSISISGENIDFSSPVLINIIGDVSETLTFNEVGTQSTINKFLSLSYVNVVGDVVNVNRSFLVISIKENESILNQESSDIFPILRYSYQVKAGTTLLGAGNEIYDATGFFSSKDTGNYILISSPAPAVGIYKILAIDSETHLTATIDGYLPSFSNGVYQILNVSSEKSGFQNGYFIFEQDGYPGQPYNLKQGWYEFDYFTYISIPFVVNNDSKIFIGSDFLGNNQINALVDETKISGVCLTDTRIGESILSTQENITKNFNSLKKFKKNSDTLALIHYDSFPFTNDSDLYINYENKSFIQSGVSVNDNFHKSIFIGDKPVILDNDGILNTTKEGTIEFWINSQYDTYNDPNYRYYFDASATVIEDTISHTESVIKLPNSASRILSVKVKNGKDNIDYFAGGKLETDTINAISEESISSSASSVYVSKKILQVVTIKIINDPMQIDYFANGNIASDRRTIYLGKELPSNNLSLVVVYKPIDSTDMVQNSQIIKLNRPLPHAKTPVTITYVPSGARGDRISIFKDPAGYVNFNVKSNNIDYLVRAPILWSRDTWHRVKATFKFNTSTNEDNIRLFVDGYEQGNVLYGSGLIYNNEPYVYGSSFIGQGGLVTPIKFKDTINELYIGSDYNQINTAYALIDNLRISNLSRPAVKIFDESLDINYNSNINVVFPVTSDLYTTLLLDFETLLTKNKDFVILQNKNGGRFDFTVNVLDSFDIIKNNDKVKQVLETLIKILKPATSRVQILYAD